jgi:hypothetical protein
MVACKPEVLISQLVDKIETRFKGANFGNTLYNNVCVAILSTSSDKSTSGLQAAILNF